MINETSTACPTCGQGLPEDLPLHVDLEVNVAVGNGVAVGFTGKQTEFLSLLADAPGRTLSRSYIMAALYPNDDIAEKILDVMLCKIRPSLEKLGVDVVTVWGRGLRLVKRAD